MENPGYEEQDVVPDVAFTAPLPRRSPVLSQPQSHANGQTNGDAGTPQAIQSQPGKGPSNASSWMTRPESVPHDCPAGLEYLTQLNQIILRRQLEFTEAKTSFGHWNKYKLMSPFGQQIYSAQEESSSWQRHCCSRSRGFVIHIMDHIGREVIRLRRDFRACGGCWCACLGLCTSGVTVESPVGVPVGYVDQERSVWGTYFSIQTPERSTLAYIQGPGCVCSGPCCAEPEFNISSVSDGAHIGRVAQKWTGSPDEYVADGDAYSVAFPMDMDVKTKATFIGAAFLLRAMVPHCKLCTDPSYTSAMSPGMGFAVA